MSENQKIKIMLVDDHDMLREGLASIMKVFSDLEIVGEASNGVEAIELCPQISPDIILMDLIMPEMDGVSAIKYIHENYPDIGIIALTSFDDEMMVRDALRAGAKSYILKNISANILADTIRTTYSGFQTLAPEVTQVLLSSETKKDSEPDDIYSSLTKRERQIMDLLAKGYSNDRIASELLISRNTVKNHVSSILNKLNLETRTEAIILKMKTNSS